MAPACPLPSWPLKWTTANALWGRYDKYSLYCHGLTGSWMVPWEHWRPAPSFPGCHTSSWQQPWQWRSQSICGGVPNHSGAGDMVDPGWLSGRLWMDILSVNLGQPREAGVSWGWLFHLFSPQLLTRIKGALNTDCSQPLGWAVSRLPSWTFPLGLQEDTALAKVSSAAHTSVLGHDPTGSRIVPAVSCKFHSTQLPFSVKFISK